MRDSYARLSTFNPRIGPVSSSFTQLNLGAELNALRDDFPDEERNKIELTVQDDIPDIHGDSYPLRLAFETLLTPLVRCAPERRAVQVSLRGGRAKVQARIRGVVPLDGQPPAETRRGSEANSLLGVADSYVRNVLAKHGSTFDCHTSEDGVREYVLTFSSEVTHA